MIHLFKLIKIKKFPGIALFCLIAAAVLISVNTPEVSCAAEDNQSPSPEADTSFDRYLSFGADLKPSEKEKVMSLLGVDEGDISQYKTITVTNKEEHDLLGSYISSSEIGSRALSSVKIIKTEKGSGITVVTRNINYCTSEMYQNALITAGLEDADVTVAGPFSISGTSALVGAMKAYSAMTGKDISDSTMDTATDELATTAELAESLGDKKKAADVIAATKQKIFEDQLSSESDIRDALDSSAKQLGINLSDDEKQKITDLMMKIKDENIDTDALKDQAKNIYDELKSVGIDFSKADTSGLSEKVGSFFSNIFNAVKDFFTGLFG